MSDESSKDEGVTFRHPAAARNAELRYKHMAVQAELDVAEAEGDLDLSATIRRCMSDIENDVCQANIGFVASIARKWRGQDIQAEQEDLIQEGMVHLVDRFREWDPAIGTLPSYIDLYVSGAVQRLVNASKSIAASYGANTQRRRVLEAAAAIAERKGFAARSISDREIAAELGMTVEAVAAARLAPAVRLDAPLTDDGATTRGDQLQAHNSGYAPDTASEIWLAAVEEALADLDMPHVWVAIRCQGLDGAAPQTFYSIGEDLGTTRERERRQWVHIKEVASAKALVPLDPVWV